MRHEPASYTNQALSWATQLVLAYTDSVDGDLTAHVDAILEEVDEEAQLRNLVSSLAGVAGHAVMVIAARLEADLGTSDDLEARIERLTRQRAIVLNECVASLRDTRPAAIQLPSTAGGDAPKAERRSGFERRVGLDRRRLPPGNPSERVNLRLFGDRRIGLADRRSGADRRLSEPA